MYSGTGLKRQGCLIKDELHFHQRIEKIDSQGHTVIIWLLKKRGWRWGGGGQDTEPLRRSVTRQQEEALQLSWENKTNQRARSPPTSLWGPRLNPLIPGG